MKNKKNEINRVTFQIPDDLLEKLLNMAKEQDRSVSSIIRRAVTKEVESYGA